jgi:hypothetical protein
LRDDVIQAADFPFGYTEILFEAIGYLARITVAALIPVVSDWTQVPGQPWRSYTMIGDTDPLYDVCSTAGDQNLMAGKNVGDFLNAKDISWGFFEGEALVASFDIPFREAPALTAAVNTS